MKSSDVTVREASAVPKILASGDHPTEKPNKSNSSESVEKNRVTNPAPVALSQNLVVVFNNAHQAVMARLFLAVTLFLSIDLILGSVCSVSFASERISSQYQDLSKANQIYIGPGLVSVIEFPESIVDVKIGSPDRIKAVISREEPRELTVYLSSSSQFQTNMLVRSQNRVYVFDVIPSLLKHQDFIKIRGAFGAPQLNQELKIKESASIAIEPSISRTRRKNRLLSSEVLQ